MTQEKNLFEAASETEKTRAMLVLKLGGLGIKAAFSKVEEGPIVTTYYYRLAHDFPIARILKAEEDVALGCGVDSVLISREGGEIAIAIPNKHKTTVSFDSCLHSLFTDPKYSSFKLPIILGVNTRGNPAVLDLWDAPHILIAGSTGAGKSVLLNSIIAGLACKNSHRDMKLILVDTKQLDLTLFSDLPHTVEMVDTVDRFHATFDRLMAIVRQRKAQLKGVARNVAEYNSQMKAMGGSTLPYYVVIIDELADVIAEDASRAKTDSEIKFFDRVPARIKNLIQVCRALGIHVIAATQRSSVKIIDGDIKANLPTRIALRLPSVHDSMTILNTGGAENLLGQGDMLLQSQNSANLQRYHGPYIDLDHIANVLANCDSIRDSYASMNF